MSKDRRCPLQVAYLLAILAIDLGLFTLVLTGTRNAMAEDAPKTITVLVNASQPGAEYRPVWNYFGADEPNYSYAPNGQQLLRELAEMSQEPVYVRLHNLLTSGDGSSSLKWGSTGVYREDAQGRPVYDWTITDRIFDALVRSGVRPLVEVGFMPEAMSTHPEPYRHTFPKGSVFTGWSYPPKDEARWAALVEAWVQHLRTRYGEQTDQTWLWEIWNEPDIDYWHGTPEQYERLYDLSATAIRKVLPKAQVGGPEVTGVNPGRSEAFLRQFLEHCEHGQNLATGESGAPLDFISFHPKGSPKLVDGHVEMGITQQLRATELGMRVVASYPRWKSTPIILGESDPEGCAACAAPQNGYRNSTLYGVSVLEAVARQKEIARQLGVTLRGAVNWSFEFEDQPAFASLRAMATDGVDKPVLQVLRLLGMVSGRELPVSNAGAIALSEVLAHGVRDHPDLGVVATQQDARTIDVLLWRYDDVDVPGEPASVVVEVSGMGVPSPRAQRVGVREWVVDGTHANSYTAWQRMGSPAALTAEQRQTLEEQGRLVPVELPSVKFAGRQVRIVVPLASQAATLVRLHW